ncbi:helix-turn-helix domain-containing protein [Streptomyces sp. NPDC057052]|uniref:helix-turn-helix domain-containing protein n=1 Tax=Streptomyces sp. NPDC057052 TaxID=3346010 RepID=UPI00363A9757
MDAENTSVPAPSESRIAADHHPKRGRRTSSGGGLEHEHYRHTSRFTVVGNDLAQHPELSGTAIGFGVYIQSLPPGAQVDIRTLAARFPEGRARIAAALRELEKHGFLRRTRERTPDGRIITRTISCNRPGHRPPKDDHGAASRPVRKREAPPPRPKALPPVPQPSYKGPGLLRQAIDVLAELRRRDSRLLLSESDTAHLAPGVAAWLERDVTPGAVRDALTADLPAEELRRPAAFLAHRLARRLPAPLPFRAPSPPPPVVHPMTHCDHCGRGVRSPEPVAYCRDCRPLLGTAPPPSAPPSASASGRSRP